MLLDISIRDATDNVHSLDDVMRALYTRHYQKGKGFTTEQLLALLREFGMPDVDGFYQRYINGRDPLPYETVFPEGRDQRRQDRHQRAVHGSRGPTLG